MRRWPPPKQPWPPSLSSSLAPRALGSLGTPGVSRSLGVKTGGWVYLSDGGAGLSIVDARDPGSLARVDHLSLPGQVTALVTSANRLYVATRPDLRVRIYELTEERSPALLGEVTAAGVVEAMRAHGSVLHVAEHAGSGWQGCLSGHLCPRGTAVEVLRIGTIIASSPVSGGPGPVIPSIRTVHCWLSQLNLGASCVCCRNDAAGVHRRSFRRTVARSMAWQGWPPVAVGGVSGRLRSPG